eukprot:8780801-Pyramimonas_sp.AAC.1
MRVEYGRLQCKYGNTTVKLYGKKSSFAILANLATNDTGPRGDLTVVDGRMCDRAARRARGPRADPPVVDGRMCDCAARRARDPRGDLCLLVDGRMCDRAARRARGPRGDLPALHRVAGKHVRARERGVVGRVPLRAAERPPPHLRQATLPRPPRLLPQVRPAIGHYGSLLVIIGHCWSLLRIGYYWALLVNITNWLLYIGYYIYITNWALSVAITNWLLLGIVGQYWALLVTVGHYWSLLRTDS